MIKYTTEPQCPKCLNKDLHWEYQEFTKSGKHYESIHLCCRRCMFKFVMWCHDRKEEEDGK